MSHPGRFGVLVVDSGVGVEMRVVRVKHLQRSPSGKCVRTSLEEETARKDVTLVFICLRKHVLTYSTGWLGCFTVILVFSLGSKNFLFAISLQPSTIRTTAIKRLGLFLLGPYTQCLVAKINPSLTSVRHALQKR